MGGPLIDFVTQRAVQFPVDVNIQKWKEAFFFHCELNICLKSIQVLQKFCQLFLAMGPDDEGVIYISEPAYRFLTTVFKENEPLNLQHGPPRTTKDTPCGIHTLHLDSIWLTQQNAGHIQHHKCLSTTKENLQLPSSCQGCVRTKNAGCIQHPM